MRSPIKLSLLTLFCLAAQGLNPAPSLAGSAPVTLPGTGPSNLGDTFSPHGVNSSGVVTERINNSLLDILETIRTNQSVPTVDGNTLSITPEQVAAIRAALSLEKAPSGTASGVGSEDGGSASGIRPGATNAGGSIFSLRNSDIDSGDANANNQPRRGGGNVFGLRDSDIDSGETGAASVNIRRPGGNVFGLRRGRSGVVQSSEAIAALSTLEQRLKAETGLTIKVDILGVSPRNYIRAANAANRIIGALSGEQLVALAESPTFISILAILEAADLDLETDEDVRILELQSGEGRLGIPFMSLL